MCFRVLREFLGRLCTGKSVMSFSIYDDETVFVFHRVCLDSMCLFACAQPLTCHKHDQLQDTDSLKEIQASFGHIIALLEWVRATLDHPGLQFRPWTDSESAIFEAVMQKMHLFLHVFEPRLNRDENSVESEIYRLTTIVMKKYANIDVVIRGY
jgi:hypothetical protein